MATYSLYNNKFYNSSGYEVTPSRFIGSIIYKTSKLTVAPFVLHKVSTPEDIYYCAHTFEDNVSENDTRLNYFDIAEGTTYPAVAASDFHGMDSLWFVKRDGTWYQYSDPNQDFNPVLDGEGTVVTSSSKINELENIYNEYGETWTDCTLTLKSQYYADSSIILDNSAKTFRLSDNLFFGSNVAIGFKFNVFRGVSYNNAESVYSAITSNISLPTSDLPLLEDQVYKYNDKFYDINYNEIVGATEISSTATGRSIYSKDFQVAATKKVISGYTFYNLNNIRLDNTRATWTSETNTYKYMCASSKDYVYVNDHWMVWNDGSPIEETNATYIQNLSLIDPDDISDTIEKGFLTFEILETDNQNVFSYDDLGNPSNIAARTILSGDVYPLYISTITLLPPVTVGHAVKYVKDSNGTLQKTTEAIIKTYSTLSAANADIQNIDDGQAVIIKTDPNYQGNFGLYVNNNGALNKVFQGGGSSVDIAYAVGDIKCFYDGSTIPEGWLPCDGSTFVQADYPLLYSFLGTNVLPDFTGRCIRGASATASVYSNNAGRSESNAATYEHKHPITADASHIHNIAISGNLSHNHSVIMTNTGVSGTATSISPNQRAAYVNGTNPPTQTSGGTVVTSTGPYIATAGVTGDLANNDVNSNETFINSANVLMYIKGTM